MNPPGCWRFTWPQVTRHTVTLERVLLESCGRFGDSSVPLPTHFTPWGCYQQSAVKGRFSVMSPQLHVIYPKVFLYERGNKTPLWYIILHFCRPLNLETMGMRSSGWGRTTIEEIIFRGWCRPCTGFCALAYRVSDETIFDNTISKRKP
jgi:hypothetical protein